MKNLLPDFILENYKNNVFEGKMNAFAIFSDISGFTPMTEKLMEKGNEGAEILSDILKKIFKPTVKCVYDSGGFITNFAGDSFTSLIPLNADLNNTNGYSENALCCANNILTEIKNLSIFKTGFGDVNLKIKIGMSVGDVEWGIIGREFKSFYFRGEAINACAEAQKKTAVNEILFHNNIYKIFKNKNIKFSRKGNYYCLRDFSMLPGQSVINQINNSSNLTKQIFSKNFIPETVFSVKEEGEFREVASVFISFDPDLSKDIIEGLFSNIIVAVNHYSGYLKDIDFGDKGGVIVCYFGAPVSHEDDAQRAISFVKFLKKNLTAEDALKDIKLKIGVTYGKVYTGFIGGDERVQYCILGNLVNLCARFMSEAAWDEVWICEDTYRRSKNKSDFISLGYLPFKGFNNEIPVYKFTDKSKEQFRTKNISVSKPEHQQHSHSVKMIGREKEIGNIKLFTEKIFEKKTSGIIYVTGEAGIGKSRLIKEFRKDFSASNRITWLYCYASEILNTPLLPFKYLLKNFFKQSATNTAEENKRVFDNIIDIIVKRLDNLSIEYKEKSADYIQIKSELLRTNSILAAMIDIYWNNSLYEQLEPELRFENTLFAICNFVMAECMLQPVVLELEDVHWLENDSREVLKMLLHNITSLPLTILCTSRHLLQRSKMPADANKERHEILLNYLDKKDIKDFAYDILKTEIDEEAAEFILRNTNGNPYFAEQLIMDFKDKDKWKMKKNILSLSDHDGQNIPSSINSVLISRFDRLPENVKNTVQTASVLGREFELRVLKNMYPDDNELESKIRTAEDEKVWYSGEEGKIIFTHALLRKAVYEMQMKSVVNDLHLLAAETIKKLCGKKVSHHNSEQISYHLGLGHNIVNSKNKVILTKEKLKDQEYRRYAEEYLGFQISIADKYRTDYRNEKALELYDLILTLSDKLNDKEKSYNILLKKVEILNNVSRWDEAKKEVEKALKIAKQVKDKNLEMIAIKWLSEVYFFKSEYGKSERLWKLTLNYFIKNNIYSEMIETNFNLGFLNFSIGNYNKAWEYFNKYSKFRNKYKNSLHKVNYFSAMGIVLTKKGDSRRAMSYLNKSLKISQKNNFKNQIALCYRYLGNNYFAMGLIKKSLSSYFTSQKIFEDIGDRLQLGLTLGNIGNIHFVTQNLDQAKFYYNKQLIIFESINNLSGIATSFGSLGRIFASKGDYTRALDFYQKQYRINKLLKKEDSISTSFGNIGKLYFDMGKYKKSINYFINQYNISLSISKKDEILSSLLNLGGANTLINSYEEAIKFYDKALSLINNNVMNLDAFNLYLNYCELLIKLKQYKKALIYCNKVISLKKHCSDADLILSAQITYQKINILQFLNALNLHKRFESKELNYNFANAIDKVEFYSKKLSGEEYIADAYYVLNEIVYYAKMSNVKVKKELEIKNKAIALHKGLLLRIPNNIYKLQLKAIIEDKFF